MNKSATSCPTIALVVLQILLISIKKLFCQVYTKGNFRLVHVRFFLHILVDAVPK